MFVGILCSLERIEMKLWGSKKKFSELFTKKLAEKNMPKIGGCERGEVDGAVA